MKPSIDLNALRFDDATGTVVVVAQDALTGRVLMVANADREALEMTLRTGEMHYRSRTRGLWHKGATSGNVQKVISLSADCDGDAVLARVISAGPACHSGETSCFGAETPAGPMADLSRTIRSRARESAEGKAEGSSYTRKLLGDRNLRLKKIGEETAELLAALADADGARAAEEAADLFYHVGVALEAVGSSLDAAGGVLFESALKKEP